jgi:archaellum component FlaC
MTTPTSQNRPTGLNPESTIEQGLMACIQDQSTVFDEAVQLIERLENAANKRELGDPDSVAQLQKTLKQVVSAQQKVAAAYALFKETKKDASSMLRGSLARHESKLKTLVERINALQDIFETIRNDISPLLDNDIRRRSMHSAYQKSLKTV